MVKSEDQIIPRKDQCRYFESIIQKGQEINEDVTHKIKVGWLKWKSASSVLCDSTIPPKLKGKSYKTTIKPMLLYET